MNMNFNLKNIEDFDSFHDSKKRSILQSFNLNRYKFVLKEMKDIYELIDDKNMFEKKMSKIFEEGCLNFNIINSNYSCNIYIGSSYFLYYNNNDKKYYLYVLKKEPNEFDEFKGEYKLCDDLIWKKLY